MKYELSNSSGGVELISRYKDGVRIDPLFGLLKYEYLMLKCISICLSTNMVINVSRENRRRRNDRSTAAGVKALQVLITRPFLTSRISLQRHCKEFMIEGLAS